MIIKRLKNELLEVTTNPLPRCYAGPVNQDDLTHWQAIIKGAAGSPYEKGTFYFDIKLENYPFKAPTVTFQTKIYHPMMDADEYICLCGTSLLKNGWAPKKRMTTVLTYLSNFVAIPTIFECQHNLQCSKLYRQNMPEFERIAREWTQKYAME